MNKRGLSNVIVVLIIIVISLIAVGLVWGVARQIISEGTEDISLAGFKINIKIIKAEIDGNNINVNTKRNVGSGNLTGIKFVFSDGKNTEIKTKTVSLKELESIVFVFTLDDLNISEVESVSIAPIYLSDSGKETLGNIADTFNIITSGSGSGICGNSIIETGEQCDDGNTNNGDGCSSTCQIEGEACTPATDPSFLGVCGTQLCGTATNGTCVDVICGTCPDGDFCDAVGQCISSDCTPATDPSFLGVCGTQLCGTATNGTCGDVPCGTCSDGEFCDTNNQCILLCGNGVIDEGEECDDGNTIDGDGCSSSCTIEKEVINSGLVDLTWPPEVNLFFDSFNLSTTQSYTGNFVKFPGSIETRCLLIIDHIFPANPEDYNKSFVRLGTPNNEKSFVTNGDNYEVWDSSSCEP